MEKVISFFKDEEGVTAIEYGLIAALLAVFIIAAVSNAGTAVKNVFQKVADEIATAIV